MLPSHLTRTCLFALLLLALFSSLGAIPLVLSHQGRLLNASDQPLDGTFTLIYAIYDAPVGGNLLWLEDHVGVVVSNGLFSVQLGTTVPLSADVLAGSGGGGGGGGALRYLQVQISGQAAIMPRTQLVAAPYAVASSRVSGDIQTAPNLVLIGDSLSGAYTEFGTRVQAGLQSAGSIVANGASRVSTDCDDEAADFFFGHSQGSNVGILRMHASADSIVVDQSSSESSRVMVHKIHRGEAARFSQVITPDSTISDQFGDYGTASVIHRDLAARNVLLAESRFSSNAGVASAEQTCDSSGVSNRAINTKGTGAILRVMSSATDNAMTVLDRDSDGNGIPENSISSVVTPTTCGVAINTKGTGADKNRTIGSTCDDSSAVQHLDVDEDGDGHAEARGIIAVKSSTGSGSASASSRMTADSNDDGIPESEYSQVVTPTTCGVAINTKGTGADKGRMIGSSCDSSGAGQVMLVDDDGDGHAEARGIISVKAATGSGSASASSRMTADSDDDGVPESEYSQTVTPTTCGVAINTKGTGADKGRMIGSSCDSSGAGQEMLIDDDGDGHAEARGIISVKSGTGSGSMSASSLMTCDTDDDGIPENEISSIVTPTTCGVAINTKGTGADKNRTIGSSCDSTGADQEITIDDDGDGHAEARGIISVKSASGSGSMSASHRMTCDSNDDGVDDVTAEMVVNADSASLRLNGLPPGTPVTGTIEMSSSPSGAHMSVGAAYCDGTNWVNASDKNTKENFKKVDGEELLDKLSELDITKWNYKNDKSTEHIGPTAQDFKETFGVGSDGKSISTIDPSGIALAAIKELYAQLKEKDKQHEAELQKRDRDYNARLAEMQAEIAKLRAEIKKKN